MIIQKSSDFTAERTGFILVEGELQVPCRQLNRWQRLRADTSRNTKRSDTSAYIQTPGVNRRRNGGSADSEASPQRRSLPGSSSPTRASGGSYIIKRRSPLGLLLICNAFSCAALSGRGNTAAALRQATLHTPSEPRLSDSHFLQLLQGNAAGTSFTSF